MHRTLTAVLLCLTTAALFADIAHRAATAQEKAALEKALGAITSVIDRFGNEDWVTVSQFHPKVDSVAAGPASPIDAAMSYNRKYGIKEGSPLFKTKVAPAILKIQKAMDAKDYPAATKAGEVTNGTMAFTVNTYVNRINVPTGKNAKNLAVKGATLAYEMRDPSRGGSYLMIVGAGDWSHSKLAGNVIDYKFKSPKGSPHVENIVFEFVTAKEAGFAADRMREIVRTTDWSELEKGLTP